MLTVTAPASSYNLTLVETFKAELGISDTASDDRIATLIEQAGGQIMAFTGRVLAKESVRETFRLEPRDRPESLVLTRYPIGEIASVTENGVTLDAGLYEVDEGAALLYRLNACDERIRWCGRKVVVEYTGGYDLLSELPYEIERACLDLVKLKWFALKRDPAVKSEEIPGVRTVAYWVGPVPGASEDEILASIASYRAPTVG